MKADMSSDPRLLQEFLGLTSTMWDVSTLDEGLPKLLHYGFED